MGEWWRLWGAHFGGDFLGEGFAAFEIVPLGGGWWRCGGEDGGGDCFVVDDGEGLWGGGFSASDAD